MNQNKTSAIILAAGRGNRLSPLTNKIPKPLTILNTNKSILDYQIERISKFISSDNIFVVVGYKKEMIMKKYPKLTYIYNERYQETNTGKSLLKALNKMNSTDVLWLNGDVVFDEKIIPKLLRAGTSSVLVDDKKCGAEEVKYSTDSDGYIKKISKEVVPGEGEALGINLIKKEILPVFKKHLTLIKDNDYFEKAIENMIIQDNIKILPVNTRGLFCEEIDFIKDLKEVQKYLSKNIKFL